jgi:hypothetical protein
MGAPDGGLEVPLNSGCPPTVGDGAAQFTNHPGMAGDVPAPEVPMKLKPLEVINLRLDFMRMVLAVLARALPPLEAARAVQLIGERVVEQLGREPASETVEEAIADDLAPILAALQQR